MYEEANITLQAWLSAGILVQDRRPAMYPYTQSYDYNGRTFHRRGFICLVKLEPFGAGHIVPHEKTYAGPIEDRLKLMSATGMQLSPIFGLFSDPRGEVNKLLYQNAGRPELQGELDGVKNQLWSVIDAEVEDQVISFMRAKPIYIADGHHRYTTALHYQRLMEQENGGKLPPAPSRQLGHVRPRPHAGRRAADPRRRTGILGGLERFPHRHVPQPRYARLST